MFKEIINIIMKTNNQRISRMRINRLQFLKNCEYLPFPIISRSILYRERLIVWPWQQFYSHKTHQCVVFLVQKILKYTCSSQLKDFFFLCIMQTIFFCFNLVTCISKTYFHKMYFVDSKLRYLNSLKSRRTSGPGCSNAG